jgi:hypothetical protein
MTYDLLTENCIYFRDNNTKATDIVPINYSTQQGSENILLEFDHNKCSQFIYTNPTLSYKFIEDHQKPVNQYGLVLNDNSLLILPYA